MDEKNELNDIILDKNGGVNKNKKIILASAVFGVVLIGVVLVMSNISSDGTNNLPKPVSIDEQKVETIQDSSSKSSDSSLFEEVEVIEEEPIYDNKLDLIAQKLKQESQEEVVKKEIQTIPNPKPKHISVKKDTVKHKEVAKVEKTHSVKKHIAKKYYVQVGSFSKYEPNKKFLKSITDRGFNYKYHKVNVNSQVLNKILIGPFRSEKDARVALKTIRKHIEAGAFLTKI
jgi:DedD protein